MEKVITKSAFTVSSNTYYAALMLTDRRIKKILSESLLFSHCAAELWNSMLGSLCD